MCAPDMPEIASPGETARAQTGTNVKTAIANSYLNNVNQYGPGGSMTYSIAGYKTIRGPRGQRMRVPIWNQTTKLSPEQQQLYDVGNQTKLNLGTTARNQAGRLDSLLSRPIDMNNDAVEGRLMDLGRKRLDPVMNEQRDRLQTSLLNRGLREGSAGYRTAMRGFGEKENDAYNQLALSGRGQAIQEMLTERNQPLNEIAALMSGSQVNMPQFAATNNYGIPTTDFAGIQSNYDNQRMNQWQQQMAQRNSMFGGLFSLGAGMLSDKRAKTDIEKVGKTDDGQNIYAYRYKAGGPKHIGLMAQEVEKVKPEAVSIRPDGLKQVNYDMALH